MNALTAMIFARLPVAVLLAQDVTFTDMGREFREGGSTMEFRELVTLGLMIVAVVLAGWLLARYANNQDRAGYNSPRRLFRDLCRAHRVDSRGRWLLRRLARFHNLESPALLFLSPELFKPRALDDDLRLHRKRIEALRDGLFGRRVGEH